MDPLTKILVVHGGPTATAGWHAHRTWLVGDSRLGFSPWEHLQDEGTEGILTTALVGTGVARFGRAMVNRGGGSSFSMGQCLEHGEWELGMGLDVVERWGALGCFI
jgi:hypothetical protein